MCATVVQYNRLQLHPSQLRSHTFRQITRKSHKQPKQKIIYFIASIQLYPMQTPKSTHIATTPPHHWDWGWAVFIPIDIFGRPKIYFNFKPPPTTSNHLRVRGQMRRWRDRINLGEKLQPVPVYLTVSSFGLLPRRDRDPRDPLHHQASTFQSHSLHFSSWSEAAFLFVCKLEFSFAHLHLFSAQKG